MSELIIDVQGVTKSFHGHKVVNDISLQVKKGEIFGFLGPNGSGKTTTIRMLCGLLTPDSGSGTCLGFDLIQQSEQIKRQVGYMTQRFSLYDDLSIRENLDFIARIYQLSHRKKCVDKMLEQRGLTSRRNQLVGELSGGWKQRLALGCALIHEPKLLLLDEPTAGVDPSARREFWDHIHELSQQGITTLVSTHYMDEAQRCNKIAYICYGNMLTHGTISEVLAQTQLATWNVRAKELNQLYQHLKQTSPEMQVVVFGETLHVSSKNKDLLEQLIEQLKQKNYHCELITDNLEDVFIYLVTSTESKSL